MYLFVIFFVGAAYLIGLAIVIMVRMLCLLTYWFICVFAWIMQQIVKPKGQTA